MPGLIGTSIILNLSCEFLFNLHSNPMRWTPELILFYKWGNWGTRGLRQHAHEYTLQAWTEQSHRPLKPTAPEGVQSPSQLLPLCCHLYNSLWRSLQFQDPVFKEEMEVQGGETTSSTVSGSRQQSWVWNPSLLTPPPGAFLLTVPHLCAGFSNMFTNYLICLSSKDRASTLPSGAHF